MGAEASGAPSGRGFEASQVSVEINLEASREGSRFRGVRATHTHRCDHCGDRHLCRIPAWLPLEEIPANVDTPLPPAASPDLHVQQWRGERTRPSVGWTRASALYADYVTWSLDAGHRPVSVKPFAQSLLAAGVRNKRSNGILYDLVLLPAESRPQDTQGL